MNVRTLQQQHPRRTLAHRLAVALVAPLALTLGSGAQAAYPEKPVTLVVAWPAGGATDLAVRASPQSCI